MAKGTWPRPSIETRLRNKIDMLGPDECWNWMGSPKTGYGHIKMDGERTPKQAHRVAFTLFCGPIPKGCIVCHQCDNPRCCNPNHLFLGTYRDNMSDMLRKGRGAGQTGKRYQPNVSGARNGRAKLSPVDVEVIRTYKSVRSMTREDLANHFGVSVSTIFRIMNGTSWAK